MPQAKIKATIIPELKAAVLGLEPFYGQDKVKQWLELTTQLSSRNQTEIFNRFNKNSVDYMYQKRLLEMFMTPMGYIYREVLLEQLYDGGYEEFLLHFKSASVGPCRPIFTNRIPERSTLVLSELTFDQLIFMLNSLDKVIIPELKNVILRLESFYDLGKVKQWLELTAQLNSENQEELLSRFNQNLEDYIYQEAMLDLFQQRSFHVYQTALSEQLKNRTDLRYQEFLFKFSQNPETVDSDPTPLGASLILSKLTYNQLTSMLNSLETSAYGVKGVLQYPQEKIVKTILIGCPEAICDSFMKFGIDYKSHTEGIKAYLQGADVTLIATDLNKQETAKEIIKISKEMGIPSLCICPTTLARITLRRPTSTGTIKKTLSTHCVEQSICRKTNATNDNCVVMTVKVDGKTSDEIWEDISGTTIQMYLILSKKQAVKDVVWSFGVDEFFYETDAENLIHLASAYSDYEGDLSIIHKSSMVEGEECGEQAGKEAVHAVISDISKSESNSPEWVIVHVKQMLGSNQTVYKSHLEIQGEFCEAAHAVRDAFTNNVLLYIHNQLVKSPHAHHSVEVSIIAPSDNQGLSNSYDSEPILKALIDKIKALEKLTKSESELKAAFAKIKLEKENTEKLMGFIAHSTRGEIISLEASLKQGEDIHASQSIIENLKKEMELFSFLSSDPDKIKKQLLEDSVGKKSLVQLVEKIVESSMLLMLSPASRSRGLINHRYWSLAKKQGIVDPDVKRKDWIKSVDFIDFQKKLFLDFLDAKKSSISTLAWIHSCFGEIKIKIEDYIDIELAEHGMREAVLSAFIAELIVNAFKYGNVNESQPLLEFTCTSNSKSYFLSCSNIPNSMEQRRSQKGSRKGQEALNLLLSRIGLSPLVLNVTSSNYAVQFAISRDLLGG